MWKLHNSLWAGDEASLAAAEKAEAQVLAAGPEGMRAAMRNDDEDPNLLTQQAGNVAVISIRGPLIDAGISNRWASMIGVTTYAAIREAALAAATDPHTAAILLDINSGGGSVAGCVETADLLSTIKAKVKPIYTYGDSMMASAAYWLGSVGQKIAIGRATTAGSIGVIYVHMERGKQLESMGVTPTVFRAGKYKALGQPVEPLTDDAKAQIQDRLDNTYTTFVDHVAAERGKAYSVVDQSMAQGREFYGQAAVQAGLVDQVSTFDAFLADVQGRHATHNPYSDTRSPSMPRALLEAALEAAGLQAVEVVSTEAAAAAAAVAEPSAPSGNAASSPAEPGVEGAAATATAAPAVLVTSAQVAPATEGAVVAFLKGELQTANAQVVSLTGEVATLRASAVARDAQIASVQAVGDQLSAVVRDSVTRMRVALQMPAVDVASLGGLELLAAHSTLTEQFRASFKAGGLAAVAPSEHKTGGNAVPDLQMAAIKATRVN